MFGKDLKDKRYKSFISTPLEWNSLSLSLITNKTIIRMVASAINKDFVYKLVFDKIMIFG